MCIIGRYPGRVAERQTEQSRAEQRRQRLAEACRFLPPSVSTAAVCGQWHCRLCRGAATSPKTTVCTQPAAAQGPSRRTSTPEAARHNCRQTTPAEDGTTKRGSGRGRGASAHVSGPHTLQSSVHTHTPPHLVRSSRKTAENRATEVKRSGWCTVRTKCD